MHANPRLHRRPPAAPAFSLAVPLVLSLVCALACALAVPAVGQAAEADSTRKTVGDLIDRTAPQLISKVMLEEKLFKTWYHGRTVLIGDGKLERAEKTEGFLFSVVGCMVCA